MRMPLIDRIAITPARNALFALGLFVMLALAPALASADISVDAPADSLSSEDASDSVSTEGSAAEAEQGTQTAQSGRNDKDADGGGLTYLVPELEGAGFKVTNERGKYRHRISFSPAIGQLGDEDFFAFRFGYSPNTWLGYEISLGHNPASSLHAMLHTFNVILRYPIPWRAQPYLIGGYGMLTVFPGEALNADPVTKNALVAGGGLELYVRDDVALRGELRGATVLGQQLGQDETVAYQYREYTVGFVFYRSLGR
jgi:hypothetical protein